MSSILLDTLTFVGEGFTNGIARFYNRAAGLMNGFMGLQNRQNVSKEKVLVAWKLTVPTLKVDDTACGCAGELAFHETIVDIQVSVSKRAPVAHREQITRMVADLVASGQWKDSIVSLTPQT